MPTTLTIKVHLFFKVATGLLAFFTLNSVTVGQESFISYANSRMAQLNLGQGECPAGTFNEGNLSAPSCAKVVGRPTCRQNGWVLNERGVCIPAPANPEPSFCQGGEVTYLPAGLGAGCVVRYELIASGTPVPLVYKQCMAEGQGNNRLAPPWEWCAQSIRDGGGQITEEGIRQCLLSGRGNGHPIAPESYCQKIATEVWNSPEYAGRNQI